MRDSSLNQGKLRLPVMGWRIKSSESLWVLVLLYYPGRGTGWCWDQIPHCRWGRCTGSCRRRSHTALPCTAPSSSRTHSRLRETEERVVSKGSDTYAQTRSIKAEARSGEITRSLSLTNASAHISRGVGVASVTLAAEGTVCVLAEAVAPADGFIDTLINICKAGEHKKVSTILIFTVSVCAVRFQTASVNMVLLFQNKHNYHWDLTVTTEITAIITCQTQCTD